MRLFYLTGNAKMLAGFVIGFLAGSGLDAGLPPELVSMLQLVLPPWVLQWIR